MNTTARSSQKEASRERILDAASRAVRRVGFHGVGVADVMREAGLTHGGFYAHFDSRDALLSAAVARAGSDVASILEENMNRLTRAGLSPFRALVESYLYESEIGNREKGCPVAALCSEIPGQAPDVVDASQQLVRNLHRLVHKILPADRSAGAAWAVTSQLVGAVQLARALGDNPDGRAVLAAAKHDLLDRYDG
ncbi:TetR/AcrR family transcriptional regulator [Pseudoxanthomonas putridarboris]|uniref:TetR/AcrR family transcriptional regulator n=1 Tax=Pseudoxanthomonas putridarboris TaxID=752605 RepID=A0ABU9J2L0_9GAMM